tara:strand:- start:183 stop:437 length:255 start_codon:yes stop_codon:yes gene_type:complete
MKSITLPSYVVYALLIGIILISVIFFFAMRDGNSCLSNPMVYGARKATNAETGDIRCSCRFSDPSYAPFYFDTDKITIGNSLSP